MAITQSFLKSKFMKKSVDIENCLASSKLQKYFKKNWEDFLLLMTPTIAPVQPPNMPSIKASSTNGDTNLSMAKLQE